MSLKDSSLFKRLKALASDSILTILALVIMNCVAQFLIYPLWAREFGDERYGNIVYVMSVINIFAVSMGVSANYTRMVESANRTTFNGDYNRILGVCSIVAALLCCGITVLSNVGMHAGEIALATVLAVLMMWRYYADVQYRLSLNYKGYFLYYLVISVGYGLGALLFYTTRLWPLALIPGEILGLIMAYAGGTLFRDRPLNKSEHIQENVKNTALLTSSNVIEALIFNGDRIVLQAALGGSSVTVYYLASLVGKTMSLISTPLNSVIIGHLSRFKGGFGRKGFFWICLGSLGAILVATAATVLGSHILIGLLYPDSYASVKDYFWIANLTQVVYFTTNVITIILLRFAKINFTLVVNTVYAAAFVVLCVPAAFLVGIDMLCLALLAVNVIRYGVAIGYCWHYFGRVPMGGNTDEN